MKKIILTLIISMTFCLHLEVSKALAGCDNPCGAEELIECAATDAGMTPEEFYNTWIFDEKSYLDQFCVRPLPEPSTGQQKYFYDNYCTNPGNYFSYSNFIKAVSKETFSEFCCAANTTKEMRYKELSNFLATIAQETKGGGERIFWDGLYFRYENDWLTGKTLQDRTNYYPGDNWKVATLSSNPEMVYTKTYWSEDAPEKGLIYDPAASPMKVTYGPIVAPSGYSIIRMNQMIEPAYWIGMGATQLTADSMVGFFGWYYNNLAIGAPLESANYKTFVEEYLVDGELGFIGAFWYWMFRVNGRDRPTLHSVLTDPNKPVCRDIAAA
ncbi:MAG: hypothetical protein KJ573_01375, partial [Proteobacteria bacterium]|nr:hypothetical protein [Pseudomonadota bacterium]